MERDLRAEGWGPEDCYPDGAYEKEKRRNKVEWWKRIAIKTGWPDGGVYVVMRDADFDAGKDDMILKHETGVEIPFHSDDGENIEYIANFFGEVFPAATIIPLLEVMTVDEKTCFDTDGNERSLNWMTRNEPEWAANVIRTVNAKNTELKELISTLVELMERSDMEEFGEDCQPVTNGEWFPAIERAKAAIG